MVSWVKSGIWEKNETDGTRLTPRVLRRGRQFHFFPDRIWTVLGINLTFFLFSLWPVSRKTGETCLDFFCSLAQQMKLAVVSYMKVT